MISARYHTVPIFLKEWSGLQCQKPSIGQRIHQVYICYFLKTQLFDQLIALQHGQLNDRFVNQIVWNMKYYFRSTTHFLL